MSGGPWEDYAKASAAPSAEGGPWLDYAKKAEAPSTTMDVVKSFGSGLAQGIAATPGAIGDIGQFAAKTGFLAGDRIRQAIGLAPNDPRIAKELADTSVPGSTAFNRSLIESMTGPLHQPQTVPGEYARTIGEFAPNALMGPEGAIARTVATVAPAVASETAGQLTKGSELEPIARLGAGLAAGGAHAYASLPSAAENIASRSLQLIPEAERGAVLQHAQRLLDDARAMGIPLSTANAIDTASHGASGLSDLQRHVEAMGRMKPFYAQMPEAVDRAGRATFDTIAPVSLSPAMIGPQANQVAQQVVGAEQASINTATRPLYRQAETQRVGAPVLQALRDDPLYARTLQEVRGNPELNRTVAHLPDDSVGVQDLVQRRLRETAENRRVPGEATSSNLAAANLEDARAPVVAAAETATGSRPATDTAPAQVGSYESARAEQARLRQEQLEPLLRGPVGRIAERDVTTRQAIEALFPSNPTPNSQGEVTDALQRLGQVNPYVARQLVRTHAETVFNEATQNLQSGPNQMGGAKFASTLRGNPQQAANLDAAIRALPDGNVIADGFGRFLDILEAGGRRQNAGSRTAYNQADLAQMGTNGPMEGATKLALGAGLKLPEKTLKTIEQWRLGRNLDQLARLFSEPDAVSAFRGLMNTRGSNVGPVARLVAIAARGATAGNSAR